MGQVTRYALCSIVVTLLFAAAGFAQAKDSDDPIVKGELGGKLDAAAQRAGGPDFWGAALVARDGEILLARGFGFADYDKVPNTPRTLFELASASKQITAAAILHLQQKRRLSVTDTIDKFFKGLPEDKKAVTVHHLLTHTSGLSGKLGVPYGSRIPRTAYVRQMLTPALVAEPGVKFAYSNVGYALLAAIVEEVSGGTFEKYVDKHLFKPAKMADSGCIGDRDLMKSDRVSTRVKGSGETAAEWAWGWGWGYKGMGGNVTTVLDMLRWDRALRDDKILKEEAKEVFFTPFKAGYACGWYVEVTDRGTRRAWHTGGVKGYGTKIVRYLDEDVCVFVLSNNGKSAWQVTDALEALLFEPVPLRAMVDAGPYDLGRYRNASLSDKATWKAKKSGADLLIRLVDGRHLAAEIRAPKTMARKIVSSLEQAISAREADDAGEPAAVEAGLYLSRYPAGMKKFELKEKLSIVIKPEYRGQNPDGSPVVDKRVLLYLEDGKYGIWPVMAKMNVAGARVLLEAIQRATR